LSDGTIVGKHEGYPYYTIGQRKGLGIALGRPIFVIKIIPETNTVVLGDEVELQRSTATVRNVNLVKYASIDAPFEAVTKVRYKDAGMLSTITQEGTDMKVEFHHAVKGIAPGQ